MTKYYPWHEWINMPLDPKDWPAWDDARREWLRNRHEPDETQEYWFNRHKAHEAIRAAINAPLPNPLTGYKV